MKNIIVEKKGNIAIATINRPEAINALNTEVLKELEEMAALIGGDREIRALVITGAGKAFVAGADIAQMSGLESGEAEQFGLMGQKALTAVESLEIPVIAAINGYALGGGCELALCCDIRIAGERAKIGQPETGLGITPGFGGTQRLPRAVGLGNAMQMILTGKPIDAAEAKRIGLVNEVYPQETLMDEAVKLAECIAANAPVAVRYSKQAIRRFAGQNLEADLACEAKLFGLCFSTNDQKMAMQAFVEKRKHDGFKGE